MATLNVRGLHKFSTNPAVTSDELAFDVRSYSPNGGIRMRVR